MMELTRLLRYGSAGEDVAAVKWQLLELGFYDPRIKELKTEVFGADTLRAVRACQSRYGLETDGIVGPLTFAALFADAAQPVTDPAKRTDIPAQIGDAAAAAIAKALECADKARVNMALDALQFAYDTEKPRAFPLSLYIRGGNLYNADLTKNVITFAHRVGGEAAAGVLRRRAA